MSLFTEWVSLYTSPGDALKTLNNDLREKHGKDDLEGWRSRTIEIPEHIKKYMRKQAIPVIAKEHGISPEIVKKIIESVV